MARTDSVPATAGPPVEAEPDDFTELVRLFGETISALKRSAPPPPKVIGAIEHSSVTTRHLPALLTVALAGPLSVSDLARRLGHTLPTTSTIVGQLSRAGLFERAEDEHDRRRTIVRVHDDHAAEIGEWARATFAPMRAALDRLDPLAREHFMAGWRILHEETARSAGDQAVGC